MENQPQSLSAASPEAPMARPSRGVLLALAAILLLGMGLRVFHLGTRSMWYDEGFTLALAREAPASLTLFRPDIYDEPPMMAAVAALGEKAADAAGLTRGFWPYDACVKFPEALFSLLAVLFAWGAFRLLFRDEVAALLGAALCAASPFQIYYAQELRAYAPYACISAVLLYCAVRAATDNRARWWAGVSASMVALLYTHFFSVWNIALVNVYFAGLMAFGRRRLFSPWLASQTVAFVLVLPALWLMYRQNAVLTQVTNVYTILPGLKHGMITFKTFLAGYTARSAVYWPLFVLGLGLYLAGLWRLRAQREALFLCLLLSAVPIVANIVVWRMRAFPMYEHRLFIFSGLVACGVMGLGIASLRPHPARWVAGAAVFALMIPCLHDYYRQDLHPVLDHRMGVRRKVDSRAAARLIAAQAKPGDVVGHASHFTYLPMRYYLEGKGLPQRCLRLSKDELEGFLGSLPNRILWDHLGVTPQMLPGVAAKSRRMWYVESWWEPASLPEHVQNMRHWLEQHGRALETDRFDGLTVTLFQLKHEAKTS